ncbi:HAMP domain-containing protein [Billgrantia aerodenitrificans]|uniref:histidine kinase n=1 Tax=Billgrantia aerodenitrificans TaxID=2733483 RepID=A0ABS9AM19_9GAMM|nr:methyl-accepting chemotaxis protein [Halomonas aerodenitrificans]MCE8022800.1 methyl-accepting chemotaxis protein [Halomonas aerodenitrificans]
MFFYAQTLLRKTFSYIFFTRMRAISVAAILVALLLAGGLGWWITRSIDRPLKRMMGYFARMAEGKLDNVISVDSHDEIGQTLQMLEKMQNQLHQLILSI